jgi:hypothetical protein
MEKKKEKSRSEKTTRTTTSKPQSKVPRQRNTKDPNEKEKIAEGTGERRAGGGGGRSDGIFLCRGGRKNCLPPYLFMQKSHHQTEVV